MHTKYPHLIHQKYRPDIDGLRAIAILAVITFHAFPDIIPGGFIGVDIFFVLSGFLISTIIFSSLERDRFSIVEFYIRRIRRIFPALILVLITCLGFGWTLLFSDEYRQLGEHTAAGAGFLQNFILWRESGYFDNTAETKPLLHLWSLAIEEQFYIFWPLLLTFVWKRDWNILKISSLIATTSFAANIYLMSRSSISAFYLPISRFWELMVGGGLAYATLHRPQLLAQYKNTQSMFGFILIILGFIVINKGRDFPGYWALLPTLGAFFIISGGGWVNEKLLANKFMVWIGLISYPLYLWHWPLLSFIKIVDDESSSFNRIVLLVIAGLLAWLTYLFIEKPLRFGGNPRIKASALLVIMIVIGAAGIYIPKSEMFSGRKINGNYEASMVFDLTNYRLGECFLYGKGELDDLYADICDGNAIGKPTVVIWGDSHAASMYQGLLKQSKINNFNLAQYNISGCPPVFDFDIDNRKGCKLNAVSIINKLRIIKPDTVILAAYWLLYDGKHNEDGKLWNYLPEEKLVNTLSILKSLGIKNIIVVGQLPTFNQAQPKVGTRNFIKDTNDRTYQRYDHESNNADNRIRKIADNNNVSFISPIDILCNNDGCLISTSLNKLIPLAWDYGHLTTEGSEFFIESAIRNKSLQLPINYQH